MLILETRQEKITFKLTKLFLFYLQNLLKTNSNNMDNKPVQYLKERNLET